MKLGIVLFCSVVLFFGKVKPQASHLGGCPLVKPLDDLNIQDFSGKWFEILKYSSIFMKGKCITFDVSLVSERNVSITMNQKINNDFFNVTQYGVVESAAVWTFKFRTKVSKLENKYCIHVQVYDIL